MSLSRDLPVYSPVSAGALVAGFGALLGGGKGADLEQIVRQNYAPAALLFTDSGTSALGLALRAATPAGPSPDGGAIVALPAYGCYDLATAADAAGVRVVLYDTDPATLGPDWASLDRALAAGATAVVVPSLYGVPVALDRVEETCRGRALVVDDAAQAVGASLGGKRIGRFGTFGVLSFGRGKGCTGGGGGALLANDAEGAARLDAVRGVLRPGQRGWAAWVKLAAQWLLARPSVYGLPASFPPLGLGLTVYHQAWAPSGCPVSCAAALRANWAAASAEAEIRRTAGRALASRITGNSSVRVPSPPQGAEASWLRFPVMVAENAIPQARTLQASGVMPGYPAALCDLDGFGERCLNRGDPFPGARLLARQLFTVPVHSRVRPETAAQLRQWLDGLAA